MVKGYSKGQTIHRAKAVADRNARMYRAKGIPCRVVKVAAGYRIDKKY